MSRFAYYTLMGLFILSITLNISAQEDLPWHCVLRAYNWSEYGKYYEVSTFWCRLNLFSPDAMCARHCPSLHSWPNNYTDIGHQNMDSKCRGQVFKNKNSCGGCIEPYKKDPVDPDKPQCVCYYRGACKKLGDCTKPC